MVTRKDFKRMLIITRNDVKIIVIAASIGGIVQYFCWKYVKNHPEIFEPLDGKNLEKKEPVKNPIKDPFLFSERGGEIVTVTVTGAQLVFNFGKLISLLNYFIFYLRHCFANGASFVKTYLFSTRFWVKLTLVSPIFDIVNRKQITYL